MQTPQQLLEAAGMTFPETPTPVGPYRLAAVAEDGRSACTSGVLSPTTGVVEHGELGLAKAAAAGQEAALLALASLATAIDLGCVTQVRRLDVCVSGVDFGPAHGAAANAACHVLKTAFVALGDKAIPTRYTVPSGRLAKDAMVELRIEVDCEPA